MKVISTYIVESKNYAFNDILFECEKGAWFLQTQVLQGNWETVIESISREEAEKLIKK